MTGRGGGEVTYRKGPRDMAGDTRRERRYPGCMAKGEKKLQASSYKKR